VDTILIVEDESLIASSIKNILSHLGYKKVYVANSGVGALKIIEEQHPDLVLVDIVLPGKINGIELAKQVRAHHKIPVIFVTGYSDENTLKKAKLSEPYGYITKPFKKNDLKIAIDIALHKFKMEKKLIESETKLKTIFEFAPDGIYLNDLKGNFIDANKSAEKIIGYKRKELIGKNFIEKKMLPSEYKQKAQENLMHNAKGESTGPDEFILIRKDGSKVPVEITTHPVEINNNIIVIGIARDITERKQAEEALKENEERYRQIYQYSPDSIIIHDMDMNILDANNKAIEELGYSKKEMLEMKVFELHPETELKHSAQVLAAMKKKDMLNVETKFVRKDGSVFLAEATPCKYTLGSKPIIHVVIRDITKRKQAEEQIKTKNLFLESLIQQSPLPTFVMDSKGVNVMVNEAFLKLYAVPDKDMILGRNALTEPANVSQGVVKFFKEALSGKIVEPPDMEFVSPYENKKVITRCKMFPILDPTGKLTNVVVIQEDITERKRAEEELRKAYSQLEETQIELIQSQTLAALGGFASGIAHEIRNPLANISASAQYCIKTFDLTKKAINYLRIIIRNSNKANKIIKELLDFARLSKFVFKQGNILQPLNKTCELTRAKRLNCNIRLYKRCSRALPKILMDNKRMEQVFLNIIINSIDSMSKGGRLSIIAYLEKEYVIIEISDTGKGIRKQDISKIFNPFFTNKSNGVGLGLSVTHRIIQSHKGKIEVESKYHKGTKFTIKLPIFQDENKLFLIHDK